MFESRVCLCFVLFVLGDYCLCVLTWGLRLLMCCIVGVSCLLLDSELCGRISFVAIVVVMVAVLHVGDCVRFDWSNICPKHVSTGSTKVPHMS